MTWYAVTRRYKVEDIVYVQANSKEGAKAKVDDTDYEYLTGPEPVKGLRVSYPKISKRKGIPRWLWEESGMPDDVEIDS